jgi:hypothetical protein
LAGLVALNAGPAQAQDTILIDCDKVAGTASIKPPLGLEPSVVAAATKGPMVGGTDPFKPVPTTVDCTGILATTGDGGNPDDVGPLTKVAGKLTGDGSCNLGGAETDPLDPLDGKLTLTYSLLVDGKAVSSAAYVRITTGVDPAVQDRLDIANGIVTKGVGVGGDVYGAFLFSPYSKVKVDHDGDPNTPLQVWPDQTVITSEGTLDAGSGSQVIGLQCQLGLPGSALGSVFFGTDGESLAGGTLDSSIGISLPAAP